MAETVLSPELVLIDPELARQARAALGPPGLLPKGNESPAGAWSSPVAGLVAPVLQAPEIVPLRPARAVHPPAVASPPLRAHASPASRQGRRRQPITVTLRLPVRGAALVLGLLGLIALLSSVQVSPPRFADEVDSMQTPSASATAKNEEPAPPLPRASLPATPNSDPVESQPASRAASALPRPKPPPAGSARRFAWAPAAGTRGYVVQFYRGVELVFERHTEQADVVVPARWRYRDRARTLTPGRYRWYVWALGPHEERREPAIVQASFTVK